MQKEEYKLQSGKYRTQNAEYKKQDAPLRDQNTVIKIQNVKMNSIINEIVSVMINIAKHAIFEMHYSKINNVQYKPHITECTM